MCIYIYVYPPWGVGHSSAGATSSPSGRSGGAPGPHGCQAPRAAGTGCVGQLPGDRPKNRRRCIAFSFVCSVLLWCRAAEHNVTQLPEAGVLSPVRPEIDSQRASSHIWLMRAAAFCEQLALHFWPQQGVQLVCCSFGARSEGARVGWSLPLIFATIALVA